MCKTFKWLLIEEEKGKGRAGRMGGRGRMGEEERDRRESEVGDEKGRL